MRLYTVCLVVFVAVAVQAAEKAEKRRAQNYGSATTAYTASPSTASYSTATAAPVYATAATPVYATKTAPRVNYVSRPVGYEQQQIAVQQPVRVAYSQPGHAQRLYTAPQQQFSYSFEAQPELKLALAQAQSQAIKYSLVQPQGGVNYVAQPQPEVKYVAQPEVKYAFAQPQQEVKYTFVQPAAVAGKIFAAPPAPAVAKITYPTQPIYSAQPQPKPHYSPADSVSSFKFSSPHVTYSNLGLLSQVVGKGYSTPQAAPHQVTYVSQPAVAPAAAHYIAHSSQPVQYVASPQAQQSTQQVVYVSQAYAHAQKPGVTYA